MRARPSHDVSDAVVQASVIQQPLVVDLEKALEGASTFAAAGRTHGASDEQAGPLTHHAPDLFLGQGLAAKLLDQLIGRIRQIAPRIDEGAVEVERNQAV